ncbi:unnamed protein product [Acanthoscelides obtectus]|uniref:Uncharacterized protein n=1 Tax=Acanthoscelides obtectus TaxID=200917 RepID=A0A9P0PVZ9_ACAOB|nr:unnamed protein product [Acanthoscelides obtectus]CAK1624269.1 hypothetical protein AOBTE_LOCUS2457 [Acanthoscelides obtectus]
MSSESSLSVSTFGSPDKEPPQVQNHNTEEQLTHYLKVQENDDDRLTILSCGSGREIFVTDTGVDMSHSKEYLDFEQGIKNNTSTYLSSSSACNLTDYSENVVSYISGFVIKTIKKCVTCSKCSSTLESDTVFSSLQRIKQYGKLIKASHFVIQLCTAAEIYFRFFHKPTNIFIRNINNLFETLKIDTINTLPPEILSHFDHPLFDDDPVEGMQYN